MNDPDDIPDDEDLEDISEHAELIKTPDVFRVEIQGGSVFAGPLSAFEEQFFFFPGDISDENKILHIGLWAQDQGWTFAADYLH